VGVAEVVHVGVGANFHAVVEGECYRSSQPTDRLLASLQKKPGIRTVINLRGPNRGLDWYDAEHRYAARTGLSVIDIPLASNWPPDTPYFQALVKALDEAPRPILLHCNSGADRTSLASALFVLLHPGSTLADARSQISFRYGHRFWSGAADLVLVLDAYEEWLAAHAYDHTPDRFREWARTGYHARTLWTRLRVPVPDWDRKNETP
jgi:protein tyrosine phosphatase (PTP) superfamily phosphohydrolase (DUF442 family)